MSKKSIFVLAATLALCACSQSVSVMQTPPVLHPATATIDFGTVPLWREADTAYTLHLNRLDSITPIVFSDSDFTLLNSPLTIRKQDSSVILNIRYQPQSVANHAGSLVLLTRKDTLAAVSLNGSTSPFERHVGDSYVFQRTEHYHEAYDSGSTNSIDSIWISALRDSVSLSGTTDYPLSSASLDSAGNWIMNGIACGSIGTLLSINSGADSVFGMGYINLASKYSRTVASYEEHHRGEDLSCQGTLDALYCPSIGFFVSLYDSMHFNENGGGPYTITRSFGLLRFHLRR